MKLYLDLTESKIAKVSLRNEETIIDELVGDTTMPLVEKLLTKHQLKVVDLTEVDVNPGPGSFTGIKIAIAIADTFNFVLGNNKVIHPIYEAKNEVQSH